jgi:DNA invertase Pin-like site-specific DNA recombinase
MKRKVAIYARVSTEHEAQISALENQVQYYDDLLLRHPEWELVERYIDEGITGTSIHKREGFLRMMQDAQNGRFDLIVTREVSRFARNTVDTLQQTRLLKSYGVEVWFTEDNIWTLNDEDGELRLSIMATLAQNESKKISQRVKAGQMISFKNGVLYGNGNILGYDRVDGELIVNKEQAETVKRIFELYLAGNGVRKIQDIMETEGRKTATGLTRWQAGNINHVLGNSFYCGRIEYRKQYVPDYLTQKKINNRGAVEKVYVEGKHEPIITPEVFDQAQKLRREHVVVKKDDRGRDVKLGLTPFKYIWTSKCRCVCGHSMNRRMAHLCKNGDASYLYQCYGQIRTGSPKARLKKGLDIEGVCDNTTFMEWRLEFIGDFIFKKLVNNRQAIYDEAIAMAENLLEMKKTDSNAKEKVDYNTKQIDKLKKQVAVLVDMCSEGDISREVFRRKKQKLEDQITKLEQLNNECRQQLLESENDKVKQERIESLTEFIKMKAFDPRAKIPGALIDAFVDRIVYDKGVFSWYLNPKAGNANFTVDTTSWKKSTLLAQKKTNKAEVCTSGYRRESLIETACFLGTFEVPRGPRSEYSDGWFSEIPMDEIIALKDNEAYRTYFSKEWPKGPEYRECYGPGFWWSKDL